MPRKPRITLTDLPTDVLSYIAHHLRQDVGQQDGALDDIAALRSVCRSLRRVLDLTATHANFHPHIDVEELRSVTRRCAGDATLASRKLQSCSIALYACAAAAAQCGYVRNYLILHGTSASPSAHRPGQHRCNLLAGLQAVRLQELPPTTEASTLEALAALKHLRSVDMP